MSNANLAALALNQQNLISPKVNGGTLGFSLGTAPTAILAADTQRSKLTVHNPGAAITIYVCQATDANGNALVPGPNPGNWAIYAGATWEFTGNGVSGAWLAAAASASGNPLTIAASQG